MELFKIENAEKSFDGKGVLKGVSLSVNKGEVVSIIGPSGSGKTTLLRCLTMLEKIEGGTLSYMGDVVAETKDGKTVYVNDLSRIRRYFSLVFQSFNLFPHYSVLKNITDAPISILKKEKKEAKEEAMELLRKVGLEEKADAYPYQLSGGQKQRVAIARALAMKPEILFFDEPTSALDPELTSEVLKVIKDLAREKMTMVIVTHEMNFAKMVSDRIVFMDDGNIIAQGKPEEIFDNSSNERIKQFISSLS